MAGHSKWANIKHRKGAADAKRGKIFSKIAREITVCARNGGGDPGANITLRTLVQKARSVNMPADNIDRAIKKGTGEGKDDIQLEEIIYEGYAPGGAAVIVAALTENKNRTASDVRHIFTKAEANFATQGSVSRSFHRKGLITVPTEGNTEDAIMELALENGAEDFEVDGDHFSITTAPNDFMTVVDALNAAEIAISSSEVTMLCEAPTMIDDAKNARRLMRFVDALEDNDDVQNVYPGFTFSEDVLTALETEED